MVCTGHKYASLDDYNLSDFLISLCWVPGEDFVATSSRSLGGPRVMRFGAKSSHSQGPRFESQPFQFPDESSGANYFTFSEIQYPYVENGNNNITTCRNQCGVSGKSPARLLEPGDLSFLPLSQGIWDTRRACF